MGLLRRLARMLRVSRQGDADPDRRLDGTIAALTGEVERLRRAVAGVIADEKRLQMQIDALLGSAREWASRAAIAVADQRDDVARAALLSKHDCETRARALQRAWAEQQASAEQLKAALRRAGDRVAETQRRYTVLAARRTSAQANRAIAEALAGRDTAALLEQLTDRIHQAEAETEAQLELADAWPGGLAELERQHAVDAALARLKAERAAAE